MREIQGESTLVRVSEGSSYRESTVLLFFFNKLYNLPNYFCRGLCLIAEVMAAMLVLDKNKSFFLCWEVNSF